MSERKLYLAGFGGNRYETTLEELKKQAFEGKIKRKDKIVVNEVVDGQAKEYVVLCEKVKELQKCFIQGEAQRAMEKRRIEEEKEAAKLAREKEKEEARIRKQVERSVAENRKKWSGGENEQKHEAKNDIRFNRIGMRQKIRRRDNGIVQKMLSLPDYEVLTDAFCGFSFLESLVNTIICLLEIVSVLTLLTFIIPECERADGIKEVFGIIITGIIIATIISLFWYLIYKIIATILWLPFQLSLFQVNAIKRAIVESTDFVKPRDMKNDMMKDFPLDDAQTVESEDFARPDSSPETVPVPPRGI